MHYQRWYSEIGLIVSVLLAAVLLERLQWCPGEVPLIGYLLWQLWQFRRLSQLLDHPEDPHAIEPRGFIGAVYDQYYRMVREADRRERLLEQRIRRFEESSASLPDGVVSLDRSGNIEWFNAPAGRMLGLQSRDLGQRIVNVVRSPQFVALFDTDSTVDMIELPAHQQAHEVLEIIKVKDRGQRSLLVVRDVTHLRHLERVRQDFVANASHELRTPLTVISGYLESMAESDEQIPKGWQQPFRQMRQQASRMQQIIADMLSLAALEGERHLPQHDPVDVSKLLEEIREAGKRLSGEREHQIVLAIEQDARLLGSEKELHSAVANLLYNAVQHTPDGSHITLSWVLQNDGSGLLAVVDDGPGIPREHLHRLTERFYRVDVDRSRETGGTGLGLAIVKHIANIHDAEFTLTSEVGRGSRFELRFPPERLIAEPVRASGGAG